MSELSRASTNHTVNAVAASSASNDLEIIKSEALTLAACGELAPSIEERIAHLSEKLASLEDAITNQANLLATLSSTTGE